MSHRVGGVKEGDKGGEDEGQKTELVEIKRDDDEEKRHRAQKCFNELNEVIRSEDLILQDLGTVGDEWSDGWGAGGDADDRENTGQDVYHPRTF